MLNLGHIWTRNCQGVTRRHLLQVGALGAAGLTLSDLLRALETTGNNPSRRSDSAPARSVILLWMWGGPSHLDTFDMKPQAPVEYRGPFQPAATSVPGIQICELLPRLAARADRFSILRTLHHSSNDHGIAGTIGLTGSIDGALSLGGVSEPGELKPTHGSIVSRHFGFDTGLPGFLTLGGELHQGHKRITGETAARLGTIHDPFRLDYDPELGVKLPQLELSDGLSRSGLDARRQLVAAFDNLNERIDRSRVMDKLDSVYQRAFALLTTPEARNVFDLDREPHILRNRYGRFRFGQCCLLARRLIESGVRFVQVNWSSDVETPEDTGDGGWDMHDRYFQIYQDRHSWMLDQAMSALLDDLQDRGLLDETIVVTLGEFGREPKINNKAGREHWQHCYSGLVAGGGLRGGQVIGTSSPLGEHPDTRPLKPADLFTTVFHQLGIGTSQLTTLNLTPLGTLIEELV